MDIHQLVCFTKVVELGSFSGAARTLNVAQTALSFHVRNLEREFQVTLLLRNSRGVKPTEAGLQLLEHARRIIAMAEQTRQQMTDSSGPVRGRVVLGMPSSVIAMLAVPLLRRCRAEHPALTLSLVEVQSGVLVEWMRTERLEMAVVFDELAIAGMTCEPLLTEDLFFVRKPGPGAGSGPIPFAEVLDHPLTGFSGRLRRMIEDRARELGRGVDILFDIGSVPTACQLAEEGMAATVIPYAAVRRQVEDGRLVARRVIEPALTRTLWLLAPQRWPMTKAEAVVRAILRTLLAEAVEELPDVWRMHPSPL